MARIAKSLLVLGEEVHALSPLTTLYFYDDTVHVDSDHDPNPAGVVCAIDIMAGHGLDLQWLADQILLRRNPDLKYVIYNRRIASAASGWKWRDYTGKNPHTDHIHASVGAGPDGYSKQPYDDTDKWLESADMTPEEHNWLKNLSNGTFYGGPSCGLAVDPENVVNGTLSGGDPKNSLVQVADKYKNGLFSQLKQIRANQEKILDALGGDGDCKITPEQLEALADDVATRLRAITFVAES